MSNRLPVLAEQINRAHRASRRAARTSLQRAIEAGECLLEAKEAVGHGGWLEWLSENVEFSERTCQLYMRLAKRKNDPAMKSATVADLTLREAVKAFEEPKMPEPQPMMHGLVCLPEQPGKARFGVRRGDAGTDILFIDESDRHAGFYLATHIFLADQYDDESGRASHFETFKRPMRADFIHEAIDHLVPEIWESLPRIKWYDVPRDHMKRLVNVLESLDAARPG